MDKLWYTNISSPYVVKIVQFKNISQFPEVTTYPFTNEDVAISWYKRLLSRYSENIPDGILKIIIQQYTSLDIDRESVFYR